MSAGRLRAVVGRPLPLPGGGRTAERFAALYEIGRDDLELARLTEAHFDATAIAAEAGHDLGAGALYGVWAASGPDPLTITADGDDGAIRLRGTVPWCTGVGIADRALVTARSSAPDGEGLLVDVAVKDGKVVDADRQWLSPAFASTQTATMFFDTTLERADIVGRPGWYLCRPGFWHGAIGVSACWAGGMQGLYDMHIARWTRRDEHSCAHLAAAFAAVQGMRSLLQQAALDIDAAPSDLVAAEVRARAVRHLIERLCTSAMDELAVGAGPEPLAFDAEIIARTQQLQLYIRQCHGQRDLAPLGQRLLTERA